MKKTAETEKKGLFERFCSAQENKARISLIIAAAILGVPHCIASSGAIPKGSDTEGITNTSEAL